jgi:metal-responsive CopG/Arc/MetJ family transcriptional regulator
MIISNTKEDNMGKSKIAITLEKQSIGELDQLVKEEVFQSRSQAIQEAVSDKLLRLKKTRLIAESAKLKQAFERQLAEEGLATDVKEWPEY